MGMDTIQDVHIVRPTPGSTVIKTEPPEPGEWLTKHTWSDGTVMFTCQLGKDGGPVSKGPQNFLVERRSTRIISAAS